MNISKTLRQSKLGRLSSMMEIGGPYHLYMMEQEGLLNTRESHINAAIKEFKQYYRQGYNINDKDLQENILNKYK